MVNFISILFVFLSHARSIQFFSTGTLIIQMIDSVGGIMDSQLIHDDGPDKPANALLFGPDYLASKLYSLSPPEVRISTSYVSLILYTCYKVRVELLVVLIICFESKLAFHHFHFPSIWFTLD